MPAAARKVRGSSPGAESPIALDERAAAVLRRFRVVFNAVKAHFRTVEREAGIAGAQAWALRVVRDQPGIGVAGLAREMDVHQSTASNLLRSLTAQGLLATSRSAEDRRAVELHISVKGLEVLQRVPGPFEGLLPRALARLDAARLQRLQEDLEAVIAQLPAGMRSSNVPLGQPDGASPAPGRKAAAARGRGSATRKATGSASPLPASATRGRPPAKTRTTRRG